MARRTLRLPRLTGRVFAVAVALVLAACGALALTFRASVTDFSTDPAALDALPYDVRTDHVLQLALATEADLEAALAEREAMGVAPAEDAADELYLTSAAVENPADYAPLVVTATFSGEREYVYQAFRCTFTVAGVVRDDEASVATGDTIDVFPADRETAIRISLFGDEIESLRRLDPVTGRAGTRLERFDLYPSNQYVTPQDRIDAAIVKIRAELEAQVAKFEREGKLLEAQRIRMRTENDIEMLRETGFCFGIENYSMHLSGRTPEQRPWCLIDFFPKDFIVFIDESHVTLPQICGMSHGDRSRKERLVEFGFRLPSAVENRPLRPDEFHALVRQTVFVSATPAAFELENSAVVAEQIIRPTGLLDPVMEVRPIKGQIEDVIHEATLAAERGERALVTTLTKRMSEDICEFMRERGLRAEANGRRRTSCSARRIRPAPPAGSGLLRPAPRPTPQAARPRTVW